MKSRTYKPADVVHKKLLRTLANNVYRLRQETRLSIMNFSIDSDVSTSTVETIESGLSNPTLETLYRISHFTGTPIGELLGEEQAEQFSTIENVISGLRRQAINSTKMADILESYAKLQGVD